MPYSGYNYTKPDWLREYEFDIRNIEKETGLSKNQLDKVIDVFIKHKILEE